MSWDYYKLSDLNIEVYIFVQSVNKVQHGGHMPFSALGRMEELSEFEDNLVYTGSSRTARTTLRDLDSSHKTKAQTY